MSNFLMKHGCCYTPPIDSESSITTCQVFTNADFNYTISEGLCTVGKSSPEFQNQRKQISWGYLDEIVPQQQTSIENPNHDIENISLFTIYGNRSQPSDVSIYRPTTMKIPKQYSSSDKFLDCISMCLWKCSSWCQKV